ncbi:MAG: type III-B CRISPR module RAMP protein Cmr4 [Meiothermus sp.]|uniref:type III-B CRISPR module RAMP protein Cmr4 n=1 Tax=Meiothermus sp. TaxID=1955249 RepID=UPI00298F2B3B|nr:type III-B CRISPR module RAMP protein Cmr4 [Meiothermus sp.]MDW8481323.1 type III-B CRISPR module RAMP protein Cmr4 [Meiothermus sp.]
MQAKLIFWQALTPVHPGTGQDSGSVVDLPVAREAATGFPVIPASSLKGVLRDGRGMDAEDESEAALHARRVFGFAGRKKKKDSNEDEDISQAAELTLTDARLLFLPVRSYAGTFAFLTCPLVLERLQRDLEGSGAFPAFNHLFPRQSRTLLFFRKTHRLSTTTRSFSRTLT